MVRGGCRPGAGDPNLKQRRQGITSDAGLDEVDGRLDGMHHEYGMLGKGIF